MVRKGPNAECQNGSVRLLRGSFQPQWPALRRGAARSRARSRKLIEQLAAPVERGRGRTIPARARGVEHFVVQPHEAKVFVETLRVLLRRLA